MGAEENNFVDIVLRIFTSKAELNKVNSEMFKSTIAPQKLKNINPIVFTDLKILSEKLNL